MEMIFWWECLTFEISDYVNPDPIGLENFTMTAKISEAIDFINEVHIDHTYWKELNFVESHLYPIARESLKRFRQSEFYRKGDEELVVICTLLHDCIEDGGPWIYEQICELFWQEVARIVWLLSSKYRNDQWVLVKKDTKSYYHGLGLDELATLIKEVDRQFNQDNILSILCPEKRRKLIKKYSGQIQDWLLFNPWVQYLQKQIQKVLQQNLRFTDK